MFIPSHLSFYLWLCNVHASVGESRNMSFLINLLSTYISAAGAAIEAQTWAL